MAPENVDNEDLAVCVPSSITITKQDILKALEEWPDYIDSTPEDLLAIFKLALKSARKKCVDHVMVSQVMTKTVIALNPETTIGDAAKIMTSRNIHGCPIIDDDMKVIGVVTESNIAFLAGEGSKSTRLRDWFHIIFGTQKPTEVDWEEKVEKIMSSPAIVVNPDTPVKEALSLMQEKRIKSVPVVDDKNKLMGIFSLQDILRELAKE